MISVRSSVYIDFQCCYASLCCNPDEPAKKPNAKLATMIDNVTSDSLHLHTLTTQENRSFTLYYYN